MSKELSPEQTANFLRDEYLLLQNQYEDYDRRSIAIKGWVSSGAIAALALGLSDTGPNPVAIHLITTTIVSMVWYLEVRWKLFQYALSDRIRVLEAHFRQDEEVLVKDPAPFQIYHWWFRSYANDEPIYQYEAAFRPRGRQKRLWSVAFQRFVFIPYLPIIIIALVSAIALVIA